MELKFGDIHINTCGELPDIGKSAPNFDLVDPDLNRVTLRSFKNRPVLLNVFPSIDTKVCSASVNSNRVPFSFASATLQAIVIMSPLL